MATKKEMIAEILQLDPNATIDSDANHDELTDLLRETKATIEDLREMEKDKPEPTTGYKVAQGKCLTTKAGIKAAGAEVTPEMVQGGKKTLDYLKTKGFLI